MNYSKTAVLVAALALGGCAGSGGSQQGRSNSPGISKGTAALGVPVSGTRVAYDEANDPVICKKEADSTSRLRTHQYCLHKSEWEAVADKNQRDLHDAMSANINPCSVTSCSSGINSGVGQPGR